MRLAPQLLDDGALDGVVEENQLHAEKQQEQD
jgi:hypothetical protein